MQTNRTRTNPSRPLAPRRRTLRTLAAFLAATAFAAGAGCGGDPCDDGACGRATADAGKPCTDSDQCEGWCAAPIDAVNDRDHALLGECSDRAGPYCRETVEDGRYAGVRCD